MLPVLWPGVHMTFKDCLPKSMVIPSSSNVSAWGE